MDTEKLKKYLDCDNSFLSTLIQKFISEVTEITGNIEKASRKGEWLLVKSNAHKMLSSVKIFEIEKLIVILEKIEINSAEAKNTNELKKDIEQLIIEVKKVLHKTQIALIELNR